MKSLPQPHRPGVALLGTPSLWGPHSLLLYLRESALLISRLAPSHCCSLCSNATFLHSPL